MWANMLTDVMYLGECVQGIRDIVTAFLSNAVASPTAACAFQECSRALGEITFLSLSNV